MVEQIEYVDQSKLVEFTHPEIESITSIPLEETGYYKYLQEINPKCDVRLDYLKTLGFKRGHHRIDIENLKLLRTVGQHYGIRYFSKELKR